MRDWKRHSDESGFRRLSECALRDFWCMFECLFCHLAGFKSLYFCLSLQRGGRGASAQFSCHVFSQNREQSVLWSPAAGQRRPSSRSQEPSVEQRRRSDLQLVTIRLLSVWLCSFTHKRNIPASFPCTHVSQSLWVFSKMWRSW